MIGTALGGPDFSVDLAPFLKTHCLRCHNDEKQKGDFRIDLLSPEIGKADTPQWSEVMDRISSGEMPPEKVTERPSTEDSARAVEWISDRIKEGEASRMANRERVSFLRLSRDEYVNTIRDLLGVQFDASDPGGFTEDPNYHGFERIGSVMSVSAGHIEKYFKAAEAILTEAYPDRPPKPFQLKRMAVDSSRYPEDQLKRLEANRAEHFRFDLWPQDKFRYANPGNLPSSGIYEMSITLSGLKPKEGRAPRLHVYHEGLDRVLFAKDIVAPEDKPVTIRFRTHLPGGGQKIVAWNDVPGPSNLPRSGRHGRRPFISIKDGRLPWQLKLTDEEGQPLYPFLIIDKVEWNGPIITEAEEKLRAEYLPEKGEGYDGLALFAKRAFRRPLREGELQKYQSIAEKEIEAGEDFRSAFKAAMLAIINSKSFLYLEEGSPETSREFLDDWEFASRLSYFLWSTMPDQELFDLAESGKLQEPENLQIQIARMLSDPRSRNFTDSFSSQWLQLKKVGMFPPDKKLYPNYDKYLEQSMIKETQLFFREVLDKDLSIREFIDSTWTMMNPRLAIHYRIEGIEGSEFRRIDLKPEDHRGGLLAQASILSLTSDGTRHRPVHRGVWLSEAIFNKNPPPPPPNVDPVEPSPPDSPKATFREKLEAHKRDANCASCHKKIDPYGLAFENYDAIGRWRTVETVQAGTGENPPVDASGELYDGRTFADPVEFKKLLLENIDQFNRALIEKLATYGLRRPMSFDDKDEISAIAKNSQGSDYQLGAIVEALILSDLFRKR